MTMPPIIAKPAMPQQRPEAPRPMFGSLAIASSGLSAQRMRMEVIAQNLANAETTRTPEGGPYQRKIVNLESVKAQDANGGTTAPDAATAAASTSGATPSVPTVN